MHRFFLETEERHPTSVTLTPRDSAHAARVLRLEPGEIIEVLDGSGQVHTCRLSRTERAGVEATVLSTKRHPTPPEIQLAPALLKGRAMDLLVQKTTELGVAALFPLTTERTVVRVANPVEARTKVEDWQATAVEACKQCGNPWLPRFAPPQSLDEFLVRRPANLRLLAAVLDPSAPPLGRAMDGEWEASGGVQLVIGPEGDFTPAEQDRLRAAGARPVSLGPLVLRAETAAIAALAILRHSWQCQAIPDGLSG